MFQTLDDYMQDSTVEYEIKVKVNDQPVGQYHLDFLDDVSEIKNKIDEDIARYLNDSYHDSIYDTMEYMEGVK